LHVIVKEAFLNAVNPLAEEQAQIKDQLKKK
jgi:hypothetical protein